MILINLVLAFVLTVLAITLGGVDKLRIFWDTPSFLIVGLIPLLLAYASGKWPLFVRGLSEVIDMKPHQPREDSAEIASLFRYLFWGNIFGGAFGTIIGLVLMLADLDPEKIGSGMAVALLTNFYAIFISLFLLMPIGERFKSCR